MGDKAYFGFKEVEYSEKASLVGDVFSSVANRYDLMNDVMSMGVHRLWKDRFISLLGPANNTALLDVAGGTGDIAFRFLNKTRNSTATICDINVDMLNAGRHNAIDSGIVNSLEWTCGNAEALPFPDSSFDYYTIAFGIRNVTHIDQALKEAFRVLRPGGRFMCLEFSHVKSPILSQLYSLYSFHVIPKMGSFFAGDKDSYQYLVESIRKFPTQTVFANLIKESGFKEVSYKNLNQGIVAIHSGYKI